MKIAIALIAIFVCASAFDLTPKKGKKGSSASTATVWNTCFGNQALIVGTGAAATTAHGSLLTFNADGTCTSQAYTILTGTTDLSAKAASCVYTNAVGPNGLEYVSVSGTTNVVAATSWAARLSCAGSGVVSDALFIGNTATVANGIVRVHPVSTSTAGGSGSWACVANDGSIAADATVSATIPTNVFLELDFLSSGLCTSRSQQTGDSALWGLAGPLASTPTSTCTTTPFITTSGLQGTKWFARESGATAAAAAIAVSNGIFVQTGADSAAVWFFPQAATAGTTWAGAAGALAGWCVRA